MNDATRRELQRPSLRQRIVELLLEILPVQLAMISAKGFRCERYVKVKTPSRLKLGQGVVLQRAAILHCGGKAWSDYDGGIELGNFVVVGPGCILYGATMIRVGDYTHFGPGSMVMTQAGNTHSKTRRSTTPGHVVKPVIIGSGVWVGAGAIILGGTVLGDDCIVGPNSVVSGEYAAGTSLIGNPARVAHVRTQENNPQ